jgi:iron complex transport system substrate-binding protein
MDYAQGFTLETRDGITLLTVTNPWQGAKNVRYRYALCPKGTTIPKEYAQYTIIYTPVERVICLATTHVGILSALGKASSIKALSGAAFVSDTLIGKGIREGEIVDIGYDQGMNYEKIIGLNADVVFAYGVGEEAVGSMGRLASLGQTVVFNAEYLERTALGKAEWIKFMAAFYGCLPQATQQFDSIRREYEQLRELAKSSGHRPKILCGLPWQGIWYVPGGNSWMAGMIADAGGNYLWNDHPSHEGIPINIETVAGRGASADLWINTGAARTLDEIRSVDARLAEIAPFRAGAAYNNYARVSPGGGNDFFESGTVRPQIILKDLIRIFHPDLLPNHSLYYYMKLD